MRLAVLLGVFLLAAKSDPLTTLKRGKNFQARLRAVMAILRTHDSALLPGLMQCAHDKQPMTRALTAIALSGYPLTQAQPILDLLQNDSVDIVKRSAAAALSDIRDAEKRPKPPPPEPPSPLHDRALRQKAGPRLALDAFATKGAPDISLLPAASVLSEALDDSPTPLWTGEIGTSAHKATYTLIGSAEWSAKKNGGDQIIKLRVRGLVEHALSHKLLGEVSAQGQATLPQAMTTAARTQTLQGMQKQVAQAAMGDIIDTINVDRENGGEPLLR